MGFNNQGIDRLLANVRQAEYRGILGVNIGKNFSTPVENAAEDYLVCLRKAYRYAGYIAVNISSPNTPHLRQLQNAEELSELLYLLKLNQQKLADEHGKYTPLAVKIAPDLEPAQIDAIAALLMKHQVDGVIATNTTLSRSGGRNTAPWRRGWRHEWSAFETAQQRGDTPPARGPARRYRSLG